MWYDINMNIINAFVDTNIVNRILDIEISKPSDLLYEEDRLYLSKIIEEYVKKDIVIFIANPTIKQQIEATKDLIKRDQLLDKLAQFHFTSFNKTVFPFTFPGTFVTEKEKNILNELESIMPKGFKKDSKVFLDSLGNEEIEVLLTTDRDDLAKKKLREYITTNGLASDIKIFTPKNCYEYLQSFDFNS
jgi:hypothetical protein